MKTMGKIALRRISCNKTESFLVIVTVALTVATLLFSTSLSINYFDFYLNEAESLTGASMENVVENGISNLIEIGEYLGEFMMFFASYQVPEFSEDAEPIPLAGNSDAVFSADAMIENLPFTIGMMLIVVLFIVSVSLSVVFSACKRERRSFFVTLSASGASKKHIKKCSFYESIVYWASGMPFGFLLGVLEIYAAKFVSDGLFSDYAKTSLPVNISFSALSLVFVLPVSFLMVYRFSKKACRKISLKTVATDIKQAAGTDIGLGSFTADEKKYFRKGIEHFVAVRNFQNNFGKYFKIIFMTVMYTGIIALTIVIFNAIRVYNGQAFISGNGELLAFSFSTELYFCSLAVVLSLVSLLSTFIAVWANINSNTGEYAIMRSVGSSVSSVLKAVRIEGLICNLSGVVFSLVCVIYSLSFIMQIFSEEPDMSFTINGAVFGIIGIALLMFTLCVSSTVIMVNRKMKRIDTIKILKDYFY